MNRSILNEISSLINRVEGDLALLKKLISTISSSDTNYSSKEIYSKKSKRSITKSKPLSDFQGTLDHSIGDQYSEILKLLENEDCVLSNIFNSNKSIKNNFKEYFEPVIQKKSDRSPEQVFYFVNLFWDAFEHYDQPLTGLIVNSQEERKKYSIFTNATMFVITRIISSEKVDFFLRQNNPDITPLSSNKPSEQTRKIFNPLIRKIFYELESINKDDEEVKGLEFWQKGRHGAIYKHTTTAGRHNLIKKILNNIQHGE